MAIVAGYAVIRDGAVRINRLEVLFLATGHYTGDRVFRLTTESF